MTCKDCIHYDVCNSWDSWNDELYADGNSDKCRNYSKFKDKSRIIELPCKVGDKVYVITCYEEHSWIDELKVIGFSYNGKNFISVITTNGSFDYYKDDFDCELVTLDKSKAEAKLKELNKK